MRERESVRVCVYVWASGEGWVGDSGTDCVERGRWEKSETDGERGEIGERGGRDKWGKKEGGGEDGDKGGEWERPRKTNRDSEAERERGEQKGRWKTGQGGEKECKT